MITYVTLLKKEKTSNTGQTIKLMLRRCGPRRDALLLQRLQHSHTHVHASLHLGSFRTFIMPSQVSNRSYFNLQELTKFNDRLLVKKVGAACMSVT